MEDKKGFVQEFGELLASYNIQGVERMRYFIDDDKDEMVRIDYVGGGHRNVCVNIDSLYAIIKDVMKQV